MKINNFLRKQFYFLLLLLNFSQILFSILVDKIDKIGKIFGNDYSCFEAKVFFLSKKMQKLKKKLNRVASHF